MLTYRTFRNSDPPVLTSLWRSRAGQPGLLQPVSPELFEQLVFAKLYFDYAGLFLAWDDDVPVGFAHVGFGPTDDESSISTDIGVICTVLVRPGCAEAEVSAGLVDRCEDYLRRRGAKTICGGGLHPINPFYLGLYGGSELPGILDSDATARQAFAARGYQEVERTTVLRRELGGFESLVDLRPRKPDDRRVHEDIFAAGKFRIKPGSEGQNGGEVSRHFQIARSRFEGAADEIEERRFPRSVSAHNAHGLTLVDLNVYVAQGHEFVMEFSL